MQRIVICSTCDGVDGKSFAAALGAGLAARGLAFAVCTHPCLSACARPLAMAFAAPGKATYLFAGIDPGRDLADTLAFAAMYQRAADGWIEDARGAGRLRHCLIGRVPA
ncbi:MAG: hypothetical protein Kow0058_06130 [Roseovarius sp.]